MKMRISSRLPVKIKIQQKKKRWILTYAALTFFVAAGGVVGIYFVSRASFAVIHSVEVLGAETTDAEKMKEIADNMITGSMWDIVAKKNLLFYPKSEIEQKIEESDLSVRDADFKLSSGTLKILVEERKPAFLWCAPEGEQCFYMDKEGFIYKEAPEFKGSAYFIYRGELDGSPLGRTYLNQRKLAALEEFRSGTEALGLKLLAAEAGKENVVNFECEKGFTVIVNAGKDLARQLDNLKSVLLSQNFQKQSGNLSDLSYIDLRFGDKVYFKNKSKSDEAAKEAPVQAD